MIRNNPITYARYYDHKTSCFNTLFNKYPSIFGQVYDLFSATKFQNHGNEHDHGLLWIENAPIYGSNTNEKMENFVDKYISCDVSLLPITLQNAQKHQHIRACKKTNHVVYRFHYPITSYELKK